MFRKKKMTLIWESLRLCESYVGDKHLRETIEACIAPLKLHSAGSHLLKKPGKLSSMYQNISCLGDVSMSTAIRNSNAVPPKANVQAPTPNMMVSGGKASDR